MPGYAQAESTYAKERESAESEARKLQTAWDSTVAQFRQSSAMMTPSNRSAREKQLQAQADSLQGKLQTIEARVAAKERELLAPMQDRLRAVIDGFRAELNFAMIVDLSSQFASAVIAYDKSLDITLRVAQRLAGQE
jgi:outer membrane protein